MSDATYGARQDELLAAHMAEAEHQGAVFYNLGWGTSDTGIASKTSQGILSSEMDESGHVTHAWAARR